MLLKTSEEVLIQIKQQREEILMEIKEEKNKFIDKIEKEKAKVLGMKKQVSELEDQIGDRMIDDSGNNFEMNKLQS